MRSGDIVFAAALCLGFASLATGQVTTDVGVGFGLAKATGSECGDFGNCEPLAWGPGGEVAAHVNNHITFFGGAAWGRASLATTYRSIDVRSATIDANSFAVRGGGRFYGQRLDAPVRAFVDLSAGWGQSTVELWVENCPYVTRARRVCGRVSESSFELTPGGGVDIRLSDRVTYRAAGRFPILFNEGDNATGIRFETGIVFRFPGIARQEHFADVR